MQKYLQTAPARRSTYCKSGTFKLWLVALVMIGLVAFTQAAFAFTLRFDQNAYKGDVWIQVQDPMYNTTTLNFTATYANTSGTHSISFIDGTDTVLMSVPVKLSDIGSGGLSITRSVSAVFYVFYDDPSGNSRTAAPDHMTSTLRFSPFELTMNGKAGDQGNITDINYFTSPLSIRSYTNDPVTHPSELPVQQAGFGSATGPQIGTQLVAASGNNPQALVRDAKGHIVRILGPSNSFPKPKGNPWPSFIPYTKAINAAAQNTHILTNPQGFFFTKDNTVVYHFGADMNATADASGNLTITGGITASVTGTIKKGNPPIPTGGKWTDTTLYFSVADPVSFNSAIYGQVPTAAVQYWGTGWINFVDFCQTTLLDPAKPHNNSVPPTDPNYNPSLLDSPPATNAPVYDTCFRNFIGEITGGLLSGFFNSNYKPGGVNPAIKDMASNQWWGLNPTVAFSQIQPNHPYYNPYAGVIYGRTGNSVYGMAYSDRFVQGPLVETVSYKGTAVNYWVVGIGAPISIRGIAPLGMMELLLLDD
jgi:hypothetical protein